MSRFIYGNSFGNSNMFGGRFGNPGGFGHGYGFLEEVEDGELAELIEEHRRNIQLAYGERVYILGKRPTDTERLDTKTELPGFDTPADERVIAGREAEAKFWGYEECPNCGIYGDGSVPKCLCGYKFTNF